MNIEKNTLYDLNLQRNTFWPFVNIFEYTKWQVLKITNNQVFVEVNNDTINLSSLKFFFLQFIKEAYIIQEKYREDMEINEIFQKWNEQDPVTKADLEIEKLFREKFSYYIPKYSIAWEEEKIKIEEKDKFLLLDPIDWTNWFLKWEAKYWTVLWLYINWYNILSLVLNTKKKIIYVADLNGFETYVLKKVWDKILLLKIAKNLLEENEKENIYLHLNFKWVLKWKNSEIQENLKRKLIDFNEKNNTNYKIKIKQTSVDLWVRVWRWEIWAFIHYWPAPHDIAWNLIYRIHNKNLFISDHRWTEYNYFDHEDLIASYLKYNDNKNTNWKKFLYKYPIVMSSNKKLHKFLLEVLNDYRDLFDLKANP